MSERIKSGEARAQAARQELADLRSRLAAKEHEYAQQELMGAFDDVEPTDGNLTYDQYLALRPDGSESAATRNNQGVYRDRASGRFISRQQYLTSLAVSSHDRLGTVDHTEVADDMPADIKDLVKKYIEAELLNNRAMVGDSLEAINDKVVSHATEYNLSPSQLNLMLYRIKQLARSMATQANLYLDEGSSTKKEASAGNDVDNSNEQPTATGKSSDDTHADTAKESADINSLDDLARPAVPVAAKLNMLDGLAKPPVTAEAELNMLDHLTDSPEGAEPKLNMLDHLIDSPEVDKPKLNMLDHLTDAPVVAEPKINMLDRLARPATDDDGEVNPLEDIERPALANQANQPERADAEPANDKPPASEQPSVLVKKLRNLGRNNRWHKIRETLRDSAAMAAAVISVSVFRAGQWLGKQQPKINESHQDFERRRSNNKYQKVAVGALAVGLAAWYLIDKNGHNGFDLPDFSWWGDGDKHPGDSVTTPSESPVEAPTTDHQPGGVELPETEADSSDSVDQTNDPSPEAVVVEPAMPGLESGNYMYPWDWAGDKFGSQNSREVLNKLVEQTDGAQWHRVGDGVDTNDWISIDGYSNTDYVIERLSQVANDNPELVQAMYRG